MVTCTEVCSVHLRLNLVGSQIHERYYTHVATPDCNYSEASLICLDTVCVARGSDDQRRVKERETGTYTFQ